MVSERQGWTNGKPFIVTAEQCRAKWGSGDRDWKLRCYLCRTEASEGDTFRWVYMNSSTPSPGNFMVCRTCDFDGIAEAVRASLEDWKKTFGDYAGWSFQAFSKFHSTIFERDQLRAELAAAKDLLARIHRDGGHHTEAVGFAQSVADAGDKVSEWLLAAEERTALAAHVERLEGALECVPVDLIHAIENGDTGANVFLSAGSCKLIGDALAATPAQSLAAHDAATKIAAAAEATHA